MIRAHAKAGKTGAFHGNSGECGSHENGGLKALKTVANLQPALAVLPPSWVIQTFAMRVLGGLTGVFACESRHLT